MLSIHDHITELERLSLERDLAVGCYRDAMNNVAAYAVELDEPTTSQYRRYVAEAAGGLANPTADVLRDTNATLRALLRDYRSKAAHYLNAIREQLAATAQALEDVLESLAQTDGDAESRMSKAVGSLREIAEQAAAAPIRDALLAATDAMGQSLEEMRKQHQAHVVEFKTEIRMLHARIGQLESAASVDSVTQLLTRVEIERHIGSLTPGNASSLLVTASGLRLAEVRFNPAVAAELAGAFTKRLRNVMPQNAVIGRWSTEEFVALLNVSRGDGIKVAKVVTEQLSGTYSCLLSGKVVRPELQVRVTVIEPVTGSPEDLLRRISEVMTRSLPPP